MFMFPEPGPKDYRLRNVTINTSSSEQHSPSDFPRCTQANLGLYSYPLPNTSGEYNIRKVNDIILNRWTQDAKAWWIGKPGDDAQMMFDMHQRTKVIKEIDPRFLLRNSIFPRSYQYELDCMESRRQQKIIDKLKREEIERQLLKEQLTDDDKKKLCICSEDSEEAQENIKEKVDTSRWHPRPELFCESQEDPCKRREEFQK